jgi:hypothetical protein
MCLQFRWSDNDGVSDSGDAFPLDPADSLDTDLDGIGNNADTDDDGDGVEDALDAFPLNAYEWSDADNDGIGDNADTNDDNDGINDIDHLYPLNHLYHTDSDLDNMPDAWELLYGLNPNDPTYTASDHDNNGSVDALTDGLMLLRYAFGLRGERLISGAVSTQGLRNTATNIEAYIESHMP